MEGFQSLSLQQNRDGKLPPTNVAEHSEYTTIVTSMSDDDDEAMREDMSAEQEATRKVMYQLALGKASDAKPKHPVDAKLEEMIRRTRLQTLALKSKDDFDIQTPYSHGSTMQQDNVPRGRQRSNSLPRDWDGSMEDGTKDIDMML